MNCVRCGNLVSAERLEALPETTLCAGCSETEHSNVNCVRCWKLIPAERMEALPETRLCIGCSEAVGTDFVMVVRSVRTNKPGSMKINYGGGVDVEFVRRHIRPL